MKSFVSASAIAALITLSLFAAPKKPSEMDQALARIQNAKAPADALPAVTFILAHAQEAPAPHLFIASAAAIGNRRVEDSAYLFYIGQMRSRFDMARYPPKGKGSESPTVLLGALSQQIGATVNPAIMREPKMFASVVQRVEAWSPATPAGYDPGWAYSAVVDAAGKKMFADQRATFVKQFGGMSRLLNDPQYFAAFRTVQDYNFSPQQANDPKRLKAKQAAEATMLAIEKKRDIEGLFYKRK